MIGFRTGLPGASPLSVDCQADLRRRKWLLFSLFTRQFSAIWVRSSLSSRVAAVRPQRTFRQAATRYLNENQHKRRIADEALHLKQLDPFIGDLSLESVHMGTLQAFVDARRKAGIKSKSINLALGVVRHLLNVAAAEWLDESNLTWLQSPPKIKLLPVTDARKPYPLSWEEQVRLLKELPAHLERMVLVKVNTGCREQEVCGLKWDWEVTVPQLGTSVFIIPGGASQEWRRQAGRAEPRSEICDRRVARPASGVRLHLPRTPGG